MNAPFAQTARMGRLSTILGKDVLNLLRFEAEEHVNDLFTYRIEALADTDELSFDDLIGTHATVHLRSFDQPETPFDGIVTEAELLGPGENGWRYGLTLKPWTFLMGLRRKQQIYHAMSVVQILDEVFAPYGKDVDNRLAASYPELEYTVQYRESDLAFACRMMERFGISYHFAHADGAHALVLTDTITAHDDLPGSARPYQAVEHLRGTGEHFWLMKPSQRLTTGKVRLTDYNFKTPNAAMETDRDGGAPYAQGGIETYDYPGDYLDQGSGKGVARLRVDGLRGQDPRHRAEGDCASLRAGLCVKVTGATVPGVGKALCLSARHRYVSGGYGTGDAAAEEGYRGQYLLTPETTPLRPELKTPRAIVQGPQTARVVGEGEIDCDEFGRILVRFHWDLDGRHSMRCRVSQSWAGKGWGGMVIPRIGMEVVVEFLEGDPDKPLVTGCVYNGQNETPYPLPDHKTKAVFRSDSHKSDGFNELAFEDATGAENISLHAQKDQTLKVRNNRAKRVDNDQVESVGRNKAISVGRNHQENIGGSMNLSVGSSGFGLFAALGGVAAAGGMDALAGSEAVGNKDVSAFVGAIAAAGALTEGMTGKAAGGFAGAGNHATVAGAEQVSAGARLGGLLSSTMPLSGVMNTVVEKFVSDTIGLARTEQIGAYKNTSVGHTMTVHVGKEFLINCGKSKFVMDSDGNVTIIGTRFNFSASGNVQINGKVIDLN